MFILVWYIYKNVQENKAISMTRVVDFRCLLTDHKTGGKKIITFIKYYKEFINLFQINNSGIHTGEPEWKLIQ